MRQYRSCITDKQVEQYYQSAKRTQPNHDKICPDLSTAEVVDAGIELMKKNSFSISKQYDGREL